MSAETEGECFFIAPIGPEGSDMRRRSNGVLQFVVSPAAAEVGLRAVRADQLAEPGQITLQVIQHVLGAEGAVADLTGANANVYYELAIRHTARLPTVLIAEEGEKLPFDIAQMRTIFFTHTDLASAAACRDEIAVQLKTAMDGAVDSPIASATDLGTLERGSSVERTLADLVTTVEGLAREISRRPAETARRISPAATHDLSKMTRQLVELAKERNDPALRQLALDLLKPVRYIQRREPVEQLTERARYSRQQLLAEMDELVDLLAEQSEAEDDEELGPASESV